MEDHHHDDGHDSALSIVDTDIRKQNGKVRPAIRNEIKRQGAEGGQPRALASTLLLLLPLAGLCWGPRWSWLIG